MMMIQVSDGDNGLPCNGHLLRLPALMAGMGHHGGKGLRIRPEDKEGNILQQVADTDCRNENRKWVSAAAQGLIRNPFNGHPQQRTRPDRQ